MLPSHLPEAFCFFNCFGCPCILCGHLLNVCEHIFKPLVFDFHQIYNFDALGEKWTDEIGQVKITVMWSNRHFGRHILTYLRNSWTYFNETYQNYLSGPHDTLKVMSSKVEVTDNIFRSGAYRSTVRYWKRSRLSLIRTWQTVQICAI